MKYYLNPWFVALLLWSMWASAPACSGTCQQGRRECNCTKERK